MLKNSKKNTKPARASAAWVEKILQSNFAFNPLNPMSFFSHELSGSTREDKSAGALLICSSGVWKPLTLAFGKCDKMVEGKYRRARLFAFETPSLCVWCHNETGARGTSWYMADKASIQGANSMMVKQGFCHYREFKKGATDTIEMISFINDLFLSVALAHEPTMEDMRHSIPMIQAAWEQRAMLSSVPDAVVGAVPRKNRI